jgi:hypothetical protein
VLTQHNIVRKGKYTQKRGEKGQRSVGRKIRRKKMLGRPKPIGENNIKALQEKWGQHP